MAKSKKELDRDLMFQKIMPALSDNPFSDLREASDAAEPAAAVPEAEPAAPVPLRPASQPAEAPSLEDVLRPAVPTPVDLSSLKETPDDDLTALRSKLFSHSSNFRPDEPISVLNVTQDAVMREMDSVMKRFNCCTCDRCRKDVIAGALNTLAPHYVVAPDREKDAHCAEIPEKEITAALVRSVLQVRAHPNH